MGLTADSDEPTDEARVAYSLEMDPALLPLAAEVLADLDALGSDVAGIVEVLARLELPSTTTMIDVGSGKGAVSIAVAQSLGFEVLGVDLFEPFVEHARAAATAAGVADHCRFVHGDASSLALPAPLFDVAVVAALGDSLGPLDETVGILRRFVRPGGFIVIDDSCGRDAAGGQVPPGFGYERSPTESRRLLTAHGDELVVERLDPDGDVEAGGGDDAEADLLAARAEALAVRHPAQADRLRAWAADQRAAYAYLAAETIGAIWVLRRR